MQSQRRHFPKFRGVRRIKDRALYAHSDKYIFVHLTAKARTLNELVKKGASFDQAFEQVEKTSPETWAKLDAVAAAFMALGALAKAVGITMMVGGGGA